MLKYFRHLTILTMIMLTLPAWAEKQGPESGGGGGLVFVEDELQLVDFYNIPGSRAALKQQFNSQASSQQLQSSRFELRRDDRITDAAFALATQVLSRWSDLPYDSIGSLISGSVYSPMVWNFTDRNITAPKFYRPTLLPSNIEIITGAYYSRRGREFNVNISRELWNRLSFVDQAGLVIHETLRHVQIGISLGFDDEALQKATVMMLSCRPRVKYDQYLFYLLNNRRDLAEKRFEPFDELVKNCGAQP